MKRVISILSLLLLVSACSKKLNTEDYLKYVKSEENGLKKTLKISGWEYIIQYRPADYIALAEMQGHVTVERMLARKRALAGTAWFNISFRRADGAVSPLRYELERSGDYETRLNYFLSTAVQNIKLIYGLDTLSPLSYAFENNYNLAAQESMVVGFDLGKDVDGLSHDLQLNYRDEIFGNGIIKTTFSQSKINDAPALKF